MRTYQYEQIASVHLGIKYFKLMKVYQKHETASKWNEKKLKFVKILILGEDHLTFLDTPKSFGLVKQNVSIMNNDPQLKYPVEIFLIF